ncbi:phage tail tape measure protein [Halomonas sp.]|uniref:phage tail tape measure protein n=1 Tax=Halomonas sp. TaxID=1486246 RepID=UPI00257D9482|nr:phage tail tape measure protein [Halomonas sp.]MCJ8287093.1 phage tail tape measure protein [Halomonas sp.]NQY71809.1 phage tail tape measure protein [Halomonas sp.]
MAKPLKLEVLLGAIDKATGPLKKITEGSGKTAQALKASRDELRTLERAQKDLRGFRQLKQQSQQTSTALEDQQREIRELSRQMEHAEGSTQALSRKRDAAIRQARKLKERYEGEQRQLQQLRTSMHRVEGVTGSYSDQQRELTRRIQQANHQLGQQQHELSETARRQRQAADAAKRYQRATARGGSIAGAGAAGAATGGVALTAMSAQALSNQRGGARLAAQFGEGIEAAERYREVITGVYRTGRGAGLEEVTNAVGALGAAFGSLETQSSAQLQAITERALTLSDAFGIDVTEAAQTAGIMVQNGLAKDATAAFDLITRGFQEVSVGMRDELPEILHEYSTNFRALGLDGQQAMNLLVAAADQGKFALDKTGDALKEFTIRGSDMSDSTLEAYEAIGLNAEQMANAIASGGDRAHQALLTTARSLLDIEDPARRANTAIALFGTPIEDISVDQIPQFLQALSGTEDRLGRVVGATREMGETLDNNAGDALKRIQRALSGAFMGVLSDAQDEIIAVSDAVTGWIEENPELASTLAKAAAAVAALVAVGGTLMVVLGSILGPIAAVRYALTLLSLNPAALTIMGIVAAAAALAAGAYLVYRNWDKISAWFGQRWDDVKAAFSGGIGEIMRLLANWSPIGLIYRGVTAGLEAMGIEVPAKFTTLGGAIIDGLVGGITGGLSRLGDAIVGMGESIKNWFKDALGINSPSRVFAGFGSNLLEGLVNGIDASWQTLKDAIGNTADAVVGWFKDKLGINSPSRVFAELGVHTVDGLNVGLDRQRDEPAKRVRDIAQRVARAGAGLAIGSLAMPAAADIPIDRRPALSAPAPSAQAAGDSITIHVHGAPGQDATTLAQEVHRILEQRDREKAARRRSSLRDID